MPVYPVCAEAGRHENATERRTNVVMLRETAEGSEQTKGVRFTGSPGHCSIAVFSGGDSSSWTRENPIIHPAKIARGLYTPVGETRLWTRVRVGRAVRVPWRSLRGFRCVLCGQFFLPLGSPRTAAEV